MDRILRLDIFRFAVFITFFAAFATPFKSAAQCIAPPMKFHSPELIDGTDKQIGAVYLFRNVMPGVDAHIMIADIVGGATLYNIDDSAGIGYYDAFQPYVGAASHTTSYIDWKITFKSATTNTDTILPCVAVTGVDVDGDGGQLQEFIEAATPGSIAVDPVTILNVSFDGIRSKAVSTIFNIPLIDTAHHEAMFQMNFTNVTTLDYRNGAISNWGGEQIRQTCIYFQPFFDHSIFQVLACKLLDLSAKTNADRTRINWTACNETNLKNYILQKSTDGKSWRDIQTFAKAGSNSTNYYVYNDPEVNDGKTLYRLKQLSTAGTISYSKIIMEGSDSRATIKHNTIVVSSLQMQIVSTCNDEYTATYYTSNGAQMQQQKFAVHAGTNTTETNFSSNFTPGIYFLVIKNNEGKQVHTSRLVKN